jgi:hypothetical protein
VDGFLITSEHFHLRADGAMASNGTTHLDYEAGRGRPFTISRVGGGTFTLHDFIGAEGVAEDPDLRPAAEEIGVVGYRADGTTVTALFRLDGIHDGAAAGSANDFQPFTLPAGFTNLTSVLFYDLRDDGRSGGIAVDNLNIDTGEPAPEYIAPTVSITAPLAGAVIGTVALTAAATDASGVVGVQFKVDGVNIGMEDLAPPYSIPWNTTTVTDGAYTITATARDRHNNVQTSSPVVVTVNNSTVSSNPYYLTFDGVDDYVELADSDSLSFGNGTADSPLTIELWFRPGSMSLKQNLIGKWGSGNTVREYRLYIAPGTIRLDLMDSARQVQVSARNNNSLSALAGGWHHLAVTYDGRGGASAADGITIYVDGVAMPMFRINNASYVAMSNTSAILQIGREGGLTNQYNGGLDEIRLWNVARTPAQIQSNMSSELVGTESGLQAYWRLNDGGGAAVSDSSPSGNTATLRNGTLWSYGGAFTP